MRGRRLDAPSPNRGERRRVAYVWRWHRRLRCHGSVLPCQYTDDPNDNHGWRPFRRQATT